MLEVHAPSRTKMINDRAVTAETVLTVQRQRRVADLRHGHILAKQTVSVLN